MEIVSIINEYTGPRYTIKDLLGKTLTEIVHNKGAHKTWDNSEELIFCCSDGEYYAMFHDQDCCEYVNLEEIVGDLDSTNPLGKRR